MSLRMSLVGFAACVLSACGGSPSQQACQSVTSATSRTLTNGQPCAGTGSPTFPAQTSDCSAATYSQACISALNSYADCLNAIPACTPTSAQTWSNSVASCETQFNSNSLTCS